MSQNEQRLKADAECDLDFFRLAPRLTTQRLPRRLAFCLATLPSPHSRTPRKNKVQRGLERPPRIKEPPLPPRFGMVAGACRRGGFLPTKTIPFFEPPPGAGQELPGSRDNASDNQIDDHGERRVRREWRTENVAHAGCTSVG
jgi:hypothetical protein